MRAQVDERTITTAPEKTARDAANHAAYVVHNILRTHKGATVPLRDVEDAELKVPREAAELLERLLSHIANGQPVTIVPSQAELTTQQAADLLNVSRPYLVRLLEQNKIEYRMVGTHRRCKAESVRAYAARTAAESRAAADELVALTDEMDLY